MPKATNTEANVEEPKVEKQKFYIPDLDRSIEAESLEEATEIANKELNK